MSAARYATGGVTGTVPLRRRRPFTENENVLVHLVCDTLPRVRPEILDHELMVNRKGEVNTWLELKFFAVLEHGTDEGVPMSVGKKQEQK